ncbi:Sec63 Brl domain-containing protein [Dunaliella salina]|uniref:Sec63 Brl domain-containing protein n=1 Tax=Dunaliella salina TaxID=3046 RepID=A0ABQ7GRQ5_DUNSA|nr:Sec63 Brl domain-containing protein [Dunaliella salina]|eukprot:KAF5837295.1 Sec63 Brl domain-containing protein [Dunaliella salina]
MGDNTQSSGLFSVFILSIFTLALLPYTIYHFCCSGADDDVVQPWQPGGKGKRKTSVFTRLRQKYVTKENVILLVLWCLWVAMLFWVQASIQEQRPFDPFEILGLDHTASDKDIKKAYRKLSLQYHPDKNPDPTAAEYFASFVSKAYAALTDEVSRGNYEKYGHPDGPQAMNIGVALPNWMFSTDRRVAPLMLLALVGFGILLPLVLASWYMLSSNKYVGSGGIMTDTLAIYMHSKFNIKESQSLVRIPETLVCAMEFINLPTPPEQKHALEELSKSIARTFPDLKEKKMFWMRKASILKVHMLLLAYLEREGSDVPAVLQSDLRFVLQKSIVLLDELFKIASMPRPPTFNGWLTPSIAVVEMLQCMSQAVPLSIRKPKGKDVDPATLLLQLPHFDMDVVKKLKKQRLRIVLSRPSHTQPNFVLKTKGKTVRAFTPLFPHPKDENWHIMLADPASNAVWGSTKACLMEAEAAAYEHPEVLTEWPNLAQGREATGGGRDTRTKVLPSANKSIARYDGGQIDVKGGELSNGSNLDSLRNIGQVVEFPIIAPPKASTYNLQLILMCDSYVGADRTVPLKLTVHPLSRAVQEGRDARSMAKAKEWDSDDEKEGKPLLGSDKDSDEEEEDEEQSDYDYDSEETGELMSGSDEEFEENTKKKGDKSVGAKDKGDKGKGDVGKDKAKEAAGKDSKDAPGKESKGKAEKAAKPQNHRSEGELPPLVDEDAELVEKEE